ncbi:MAG: heme A synthase [Actinobacteria bacterium]|nr:heme A synthase [Actinomycetota bacterium]
MPPSSEGSSWSGRLARGLAWLRPSGGRLDPDAYRRVTAVALWLIAFIVVTGAAVRLTGSGLGCSDWPNCERGRFVAPLRVKPMVEFVNRVITGYVSVAVAVAVLGARRRVPLRRDLTWLSWGLVAGVAAQIALGAVVVVFELNPVLVQGHFVLSMALVANAVVLHHRAGLPDGEDGAAVATRPRVPLGSRRLAWVAVGLAAVVILTGTAVTGSGPHAGDERAKRLPFSIHRAAQVHGVAMLVFLAAVLAFAWRMRRHGAPEPVVRATSTLLFVLVAQAAVGYTQYFTGIPALLVGIHVAGATAVWVAALRFALSLRAPAPGPSPTRPDLGHDDHRTGRGAAGRDLVAHR